MNSFVVNTCSFLDKFSSLCEEKITLISGKITELEILATILEAKLNSIPELSDSPNDFKALEKQIDSLIKDGIEGETETVSHAIIAYQVADVAVEDDPTQVAVRDHPGYSPFIKLLKIGVPAALVKSKVALAGLNPDLVDNPDAKISYLLLET